METPIQFIEKQMRVLRCMFDNKFNYAIKNMSDCYFISIDNMDVWHSADYDRLTNNIQNKFIATFRSNLLEFVFSLETHNKKKQQ